MRVVKGLNESSPKTFILHIRVCSLANTTFASVSCCRPLVVVHVAGVVPPFTAVV